VSALETARARSFESVWQNTRSVTKHPTLSGGHKATSQKLQYFVYKKCSNSFPAGPAYYQRKQPNVVPECQGRQRKSTPNKVSLRLASLSQIIHSSL